MQKFYGNPISMLDFGRTIKWKREQIEKIKAQAESCKFIASRISCPICQSNNLSNYIKVHGFDYLICKHCNHVFYQQYVDLESIKKIYNNETPYLDFYIDEYMYAKRIKYIAEPRIRFIAEHLFNNEVEKIAAVEWLDIGSGGGHMLVAAKNHGFMVRGIEAGNKGQYVAKKFGIPINQCYVNANNIGKYIGSAGIISLFDVIEHLIDPIDLVKAIADNMSQDTSLVISVPRHPSYSMFSMMCKSDATSRYTIVPDHIHIFSDESMQNLLKQSGLSIEYIWYYGQDFFELLNTMLYLGESGKELEDFSDYYYNKINNIQKSIDENGLSDSMFVIAKKIIS